MPEVQDPKQFLSDFIAASEKAKHRVFLQSMLFEKGEVLQSLEPVLIKKAQEGVDVRVTTDWISQRYVHDNPNILPTLSRRTRQINKQVHTQTKLLIQKWSQAGIKFTVTNIPSVFSPLSIFGRNHIKMYIVDEDAAWVGGVNLTDLSFGWIDFMVKFKDRSVIDAVTQQFFKVNENKPTENYTVSFGLHELLVDSGIRGNSIIYDAAIELIKQAIASITFVSQFVPDEKLLEELINAGNRDVKVTIITSSKNSRNINEFPYNVPYLRFLRRIKNRQNISLFHQNKKVHAKLLIVDEEKALFGSHNLVYIGVLLATEEIAIRTVDLDLVKQLSHFIETHTVTK